MYFFLIQYGPVTADRHVIYMAALGLTPFAGPFYLKNNFTFSTNQQPKFTEMK